MFKNFVMTGIVLVAMASSVLAQQSPWGSVLKSAPQVAVQQLTPQAQTVVNEAGKLAAGAPRENFIVTQAKQFLAGGNYQTALDLANYVMTTLNSGSIDAQKIMTDAKAALAKIAQEKLTQVQQTQAQAAAAQQAQAEVGATGTALKGLLGTTK